MERQYPTNLSDEQWKIIKKLLPKPAWTGRPPLDRRLVINAILYIVRTGCQWRMLPHDFPHWKSVYTVFWRYRQAGLWKEIHDKLREEVRHIAVDSLGLLLVVAVHGCYWQDYDGARMVFMALADQFKRIRVVFADSAYGRNGLPTWVKDTFGYILQCVLRPAQVKGFVVLPKRWIVERTFAWINRHRRHSKDYERTVESSEAMIYIAMTGLMLRRLKPTQMPV